MDATSTIIGIVPVILAVAMILIIVRNFKDGYSIQKMKEAIGGIVMLLVAFLVIFGLTGGGSDPEPEPEETFSVLFSVASDSEGYGTVSLSDISQVPDGTSVTVGQTISIGSLGSSTATPAESTSQYAYAFAGWTGADDSSTPAPTEITGDAHFYAHFTREIREYTAYFHVASDSEGYGTISAASIAGIPYGTAVTVGQTIAVGSVGSSEALPADSTLKHIYDFVEWTGADDSSTPAPTTITGDTHYYAHFAAEQTMKSYLYVINADRVGSVQSVEASVDHSDLQTVSVSRTSSTAGKQNISEFWDFDSTTGIGPFNSFYAAFNIEDNSGMAGEVPVSTEAGRMAYVLNPYDLGTTLSGTALEGDYNVMLVIPTVYTKTRVTDDAFVIYASSDATYSYGTHTQDNMGPFAHRESSSRSDSIWPYIGIGVYESHYDGTRLISSSGKQPSTNLTYNTAKAAANALETPEGSAYQVLNFFQLNLYKTMATAIMGTTNVQAMLGNGYVDDSTLYATGLADALGPWDATSQVSKLLIENSWGGIGEITGDAYIEKSTSSIRLEAGSHLGGLNWSSTTSKATHSFITSSLYSDGWQDVQTIAPTEGFFYTESTVTDSTAADFAKTGDYITVPSVSNSKLMMLFGGSSTGRDAAGIYYLSSVSSTSSAGARLAYMIAEDAIDPTASPDRALSAIVPDKITMADAQRMLAEALEDEAADLERSVESMESDPDADAAELAAAREEIERIRTSLADTRTQMKTLSAGGLSPAP